MPFASGYVARQQPTIFIHLMVASDFMVQEVLMRAPKLDDDAGPINTKKSALRVVRATFKKWRIRKIAAKL